MKKTLLSLIGLFAVAAIFAQGVIPNGGFENVAPYNTSTTQTHQCPEGSPGPFNWPGGNSWVSLNSDQANSGYPNLTDSTMRVVTAGSHTGNNHLRLLTDSGCAPLFSTYKFSGFAALYPANVSFGGIPPALSISGGLPFNSRPDSITGWFRYYPSGTDTFSVNVLLSRWNATTSSRDTIGWVKYDTTYSANVSSWTMFTDTINYKSHLLPDTMFLYVLSSPLSYQSIHDGTELHLDDLLFAGIDSTQEDTTSGIGITEKQKMPAITLYPNPARSEVTIQLNGAKSGNLHLMNILGQEVKMERIFKTNATIDLSGLDNGVYIYRFVPSGSTSSSQTGRLVIRK